jgi:hypothetical protein
MGEEVEVKLYENRDKVQFYALFALDNKGLQHKQAHITHNTCTQNTQHTTHNTQHTTHNTQKHKHTTQHTTHNTQHTTHNTQHTTHNTQHTTHTTHNTQHINTQTPHTHTPKHTTNKKAQHIPLKPLLFQPLLGFQNYPLLTVLCLSKVSRQKLFWEIIQKRIKKLWNAGGTFYKNGLKV